MNDWKPMRRMAAAKLARLLPVIESHRLRVAWAIEAGKLDKLAAKAKAKFMTEMAEWVKSRGDFDATAALNKLQKKVEEFPNEAFKLMPWMSTEMRRGHEEYADVLLGWNDIGAAGKAAQVLRTNNKPVPDINAFRLDDLLSWSKSSEVREMVAEIMPTEWKDPKHVHQLQKNHVIHKITNADDATQEGDLMGHCVGSYGSRIEDGQTHIFSIRDEKHRPHVTIEALPGKGEVDGPRPVQNGDLMRHRQYPLLIGHVKEQHNLNRIIVKLLDPSMYDEVPDNMLDHDNSFFAPLYRLVHVTEFNKGDRVSAMAGGGWVDGVVVNHDMKNGRITVGLDYNDGTVIVDEGMIRKKEEKSQYKSGDMVLLREGQFIWQTPGPHKVVGLGDNGYHVQLLQEGEVNGTPIVVPGKYIDSLADGTVPPKPEQGDGHGLPQNIKISQVFGKQDRAPIAKYRHMVREWFDHLRESGHTLEWAAMEFLPREVYNMGHAQEVREFLEQAQQQIEEHDEDGNTDALGAAHSIVEAGGMAHHYGFDVDPEVMQVNWKRLLADYAEKTWEYHDDDEWTDSDNDPSEAIRALKAVAHVKGVDKAQLRTGIREAEYGLEQKHEEWRRSRAEEALQHGGGWEEISENAHEPIKESIDYEAGQTGHTVDHVQRLFYHPDKDMDEEGGWKDPDGQFDAENAYEEKYEYHREDAESVARDEFLENYHPDNIADPKYETESALSDLESELVFRDEGSLKSVLDLAMRPDVNDNYVNEHWQSFARFIENPQDGWNDNTHAPERRIPQLVAWAKQYVEQNHSALGWQQQLKGDEVPILDTSPRTEQVIEALERLEHHTAKEGYPSGSRSAQSERDRWLDKHSLRDPFHVPKGPAAGASYEQMTTYSKAWKEAVMSDDSINPGDLVQFPVNVQGVKHTLNGKLKSWRHDSGGIPIPEVEVHPQEIQAFHAKLKMEEVSDWAIPKRVAAGETIHHPWWGHLKKVSEPVPDVMPHAPGDWQEQPGEGEDMVRHAGDAHFRINDDGRPEYHPAQQDIPVGTIVRLKDDIPLDEDSYVTEAFLEQFRQKVGERSFEVVSSAFDGQFTRLTLRDLQAGHEMQMMRSDFFEPVQGATTPDTMPFDRNDWQQVSDTPEQQESLVRNAALDPDDTTTFIISTDYNPELGFELRQEIEMGHYTEERLREIAARHGEDSPDKIDWEHVAAYFEEQIQNEEEPDEPMTMPQGVPQNWVPTSDNPQQREDLVRNAKADDWIEAPSER